MKIGNVIKVGIAAGAVILVISWVVSTLTSMLWPYNVLALGGMRQVNDPIMVLFFLHPFVLGLALTYFYVYLNLNNIIKGGAIEKGRKFGLLMWLISSLPSAFLVFSSMDYPIGFTVNTLIGPLLYMIGAGAVISNCTDGC